MARHYTEPQGDHVVEPFAGSAGYSTYWDLEVAHLVEINPGIVAVWDYLIHAHPEDIERLPDRVETMADLPPEMGPRNLMLLWLNKGRAEVPAMISPWYFQHRDAGNCRVWGPPVKHRLQEQVERIKGWTISQGDYRSAMVGPRSHVHLDPPFSGQQGRRYAFDAIDYQHLAEWCLSLDAGFIQVCESASATWLPFRYLRDSETTRGKRSGRRFAEGIWERQGDPYD